MVSSGNLIDDTPREMDPEDDVFTVVIWLFPETLSDFLT